MSVGRLAFDSFPRNYIARAGQLPLLGKLVAGSDCVIGSTFLDWARAEGLLS
jgi:hypothetical protein